MRGDELPQAGSRAFEFRILGPVQAVRDGRELALGGPKRRAVLALLLVAGGRVVPAERLAEDLWGASPPPGAAGTLRSHLSRLRTLVGPDAALIARGGGYALAAGPDQLDADRFERLARAGREGLEHGEAAAAAARFREALGLWRGRALADVADVAALAREGARLEELRLVALEGRIEADVELGLAAEVAGELEGLVAGYPLRERLWRLLVLALYRSGRQADALAAYRRARTVLAEELGIEPGEELRQLERAVLRQQVPAAAPRRQQHNLPARLTSFVGRERDLAALDNLLGQARLVTLAGAGGAGKTRLAVEFGAAAAGRFGDGAWLADLAGIADPELVPPQVMEALGVRQTGEMPVIEALRYRLQSAELLLVLDNCEHLLGACAALATALLGSSPGLRVLATSREPLGVPGEAVFPVPPLAVPPEGADAEALARAPAVRLFLARSALARAGAPGRRRSRWWPGSAGRWMACRWRSSWPPRARACCRRRRSRRTWRTGSGSWLICGRWPTRGTRRWGPRSPGAMSCWPKRERQGFRALSVFAGGFDLAAVAAVCCDGNEPAALDLVDLLAGKSLVVAEPAAGGSRYRLLETIRQYAAERLAEAGEAEQARQRHAETFLALAGRERRLGVLLREHDNFRAALDYALAAGDPAGPRLARALGGFWLARGLLQEGQGWLERALATGPTDPRLHADLLRLLGTVLYAAGDIQQARTTLGQAAEAAEAAGATSLQARIRVHAGGNPRHPRWNVGRSAPGVPGGHTGRSRPATTWKAWPMPGCWSASCVCGAVTIPSVPSRRLERAADCARRSANHRAEHESAKLLVYHLFDLPIPFDEAVSRAESLLQAASGDSWAEAEILLALSLLYSYAGRFADARAALRQSQSVFAGAGAKFNVAWISRPGRPDRADRG